MICLRFLASLMMGMSAHEAKARIPDIETFTELGDFLQMPVRTYSSGMMIRLMFAVATSVQPEILLVDEMFGAGDAAFRDKARQRMRGLVSEAKIFVFASHDHELLREHCNRVFELEHGRITERPLSVLSGG